MKARFEEASQAGAVHPIDILDPFIAALLVSVVRGVVFDAPPVARSVDASVIMWIVHAPLITRSVDAPLIAIVPIIDLPLVSFAPGIEIDLPPWQLGLDLATGSSRRPLGGY